MISIPLDHEAFVPCFTSLGMFQCLPVYSLWELEWTRTCCCVKTVLILTMLNWFMVIFRSTISYFFVYPFYEFLFLILKLQLKILIYLLEK